MISAVDDLDSVIRSIKMGATDYLPKPFNAALLGARITTSLAGKRLRDLDSNTWNRLPASLPPPPPWKRAPSLRFSDGVVGCRDDALGQLARVFEKMAAEVRTREERLRRRSTSCASKSIKCVRRKKSPRSPRPSISSACGPGN